MFELIILGIWGLLTIMGLMVQLLTERKQWAAERRDLLNRVMSRDYREYAAAELEKATDPPTVKAVKVVSVEELRRDLEEDERGPLGMPV